MHERRSEHRQTWATGIAPFYEIADRLLERSWCWSGKGRLDSDGDCARQGMIARRVIDCEPQGIIAWLLQTRIPLTQHTIDNRLHGRIGIGRILTLRGDDRQPVFTQSGYFHDVEGKVLNVGGAAHLDLASQNGARDRAGNGRARELTAGAPDRYGCAGG